MCRLILLFAAIIVLLTVNVLSARQSYYTHNGRTFVCPVAKIGCKRIPKTCPEGQSVQGPPPRPNGCPGIGCPSCKPIVNK
ncbi:ATP-dependent RNA helicase DHH1 [Acrasis kona]|uniref:ATP-dependent RNA helicase DHH1 n=1 Tax=Acrasis kona TaxID=1008807 RepID=A0AAW2YS76_9EUKA